MGDQGALWRHVANPCPLRDNYNTSSDADSHAHTTSTALLPPAARHARRRSWLVEPRSQAAAAPPDWPAALALYSVAARDDQAGVVAPAPDDVRCRQVPPVQKSTSAHAGAAATKRDASGGAGGRKGAGGAHTLGGGALAAAWALRYAPSSLGARGSAAVRTRGGAVRSSSLHPAAATAGCQRRCLRRRGYPTSRGVSRGWPPTVFHSPLPLASLFPNPPHSCPIFCVFLSFCHSCQAAATSPGVFSWWWPPTTSPSSRTPPF